MGLDAHKGVGVRDWLRGADVALAAHSRNFALGFVYLRVQVSLARVHGLRVCAARGALSEASIDEFNVDLSGGLVFGRFLFFAELDAFLTQ